jgi:hypothetical protein
MRKYRLNGPVYIATHSLQQRDLDDPYNPSHAHTRFVTDYDNGMMDKFPHETISSVPATETPQYRNILTYDGVLNDLVFAPNQGPSFPAHQYAIAGQAGGYDFSNEDIAENPTNNSFERGCHDMRQVACA